MALKATILFDIVGEEEAQEIPPPPYKITPLEVDALFPAIVLFEIDGEDPLQ